ncbi:MAG: NAD(P)/FAD-dependent oxidoreductase, partial [Clostridia bacterium]|nr:NAD(P)/FAD-dependent oxidoreductase [Clostridia bacterium]
MNYDIIVIGAGASGMTAAITAKRCAPSLSVAILEGKDRVGKKLLTTGNGRCNITNSDDSLIHYHSSTGDVKKYLDKFSLYDTMSFFESMGVDIVDDGGDKLFPASFQAATVLDVLRF